MTNEAFKAAAPIATGNPELGLTHRQKPLGGAIDGVEMEVGSSVKKEKADKSAAAAAVAPAAAEEPDPDNPFGRRGGRRRTNNAWLRSKPVRYTRRKFYK